MALEKEVDEGTRGEALALWDAVAVELAEARRTVVAVDWDSRLGEGERERGAVRVCAAREGEPEVERVGEGRRGVGVGLLLPLANAAVEETRGLPLRVGRGDALEV